MSDVIERIKNRIEETKTEYDGLFKEANQTVSRASYMGGVMAMNETLRICDEELAKEPQECNWTKGIHSVETCWGDIDVKTFNLFKRQGAKFCPYCGRKII